MEYRNQVAILYTETSVASMGWTSQGQNGRRPLGWLRMIKLRSSENQIRTEKLVMASQPDRVVGNMAITNDSNIRKKQHEKLVPGAQRTAREDVVGEGNSDYGLITCSRTQHCRCFMLHDISLIFVFLLLLLHLLSVTRLATL